MKIVWPWEQKQVKKELDSVENLLASAFKPVSARPTFVKDLRKRLVGSRNPLARAGLSTLEFVFLIGGALVGLVVLIFTIIRSIGGLFGRLRPGAKTRQPREKKKAIVSEPKKRAA